MCVYILARFPILCVFFNLFFMYTLDDDTKNAGKSTLLAAASAAKPKIADYPFTTIFPNLGVCDIGDEGAGLVLCDIPGLIEGAAEGTGLGLAFLRHVRRCKVLLHVVDGNAEDPIGDFIAINKELQAYDDVLAQKPQVVVLNKVDIPEVQEKQEKLLEELKRISGHGRVLAISAATTHRVKELMGRLKKFVTAQPEDEEENPAEIDFSLSALDMDSDDYGMSTSMIYASQLLCSRFVTLFSRNIKLFLGNVVNLALTQ